MLYGLLNRAAVNFTPDKDIPSLEGKVIFITGGNVGLGKETIFRLSKHNPSHIYLSARSESKATTAIADLTSLVPSAKISFIQCDLTSLQSVVSAARTFTSLEKRLDILFLNAGIMATPAGTTKEGYEVQFGTNHVGHALLTKLLLPTLLETAKLPNADVRVVALASIGHLAAPSAGIVFKDLKSDMSSYGTMARYGQSKLSNILYVKALAKRYPSITAISVHPGVVDTELYRTMFSGYFGLGKLLNKAKGLFYTSVEGGAKNQLWAATAKKEGVRSGEYYTPVAVTGQGGKKAGDEKLAEELWEWTEKELKDYNL